MVAVGLCLSTYLLGFALGRAIDAGLLFVVLAVGIVISGSVLMMTGATYFYRAASELLYPAAHPQIIRGGSP
jgi:hypothetical protein